MHDFPILVSTSSKERNRSKKSSLSPINMMNSALYGKFTSFSLVVWLHLFNVNPRLFFTFPHCNTGFYNNCIKSFSLASRGHALITIMETFYLLHIELYSDDSNILSPGKLKRSIPDGTYMKEPFYHIIYAKVKKEILYIIDFSKRHSIKVFDNMKIC